MMSDMKIPTKHSDIRVYYMHYSIARAFENESAMMLGISKHGLSGVFINPAFTYEEAVTSLKEDLRSYGSLFFDSELKITNFGSLELNDLMNMAFEKYGKEMPKKKVKK